MYVYIYICIYIYISIFIYTYVHTPCTCAIKERRGGVRGKRTGMRGDSHEEGRKEG
jgi:hypothetical protein